MTVEYPQVVWKLQSNTRKHTQSSVGFQKHAFPPPGKEVCQKYVGIKVF